MTRNEQILALRGLLSYTLIAKRLGISRNVVAGVCFRADWPPEDRVCSPNTDKPTKCGVGRHGSGKQARLTANNHHLYLGGKPKRRWGRVRPASRTSPSLPR